MGWGGRNALLTGFGLEHQGLKRCLIHVYLCLLRKVKYRNKMCPFAIAGESQASDVTVSAVLFFFCLDIMQSFSVTALSILVSAKEISHFFLGQV